MRKITKWMVSMLVLGVLAGCAGFNLSDFDSVKEGAIASATLEYKYYAFNKDKGSLKAMAKSALKSAVGAEDTDIDSQLAKISWGYYADQYKTELQSKLSEVLPFEFVSADIDIDPAFLKKMNEKISSALGGLGKFAKLSAAPSQSGNEVIKKKLVYGGKERKCKFTWAIDLDSAIYPYPYKVSLNPSNGRELAKVFKDNPDIEAVVLSKLTIRPMETKKILLVPTQIKIVAFLNVAVIKKGGKTILQEYVVGEATEVITSKMLPESAKKFAADAALSTNKTAFRVDLGDLEYQISDAVTNAVDKVGIKIKELFMTYR